MTSTRTPNSPLIGNMDNKLKNCMIKVSLGASLAFAPLMDCNGAKKETPAVKPEEPTNPKLTAKYWQDRLDTLLNQVKEYGDVEFTPETYTPYLEELNRFQELLKKAEQGYLNNYTVGEYELAASNLAAKIANLKVQQKEVNNDPYDTDFALRDAIDEFFKKVPSREYSEQEQKALSDELKEVFIKAYARDSFSKNLPFSSEEIRKGFTITKYNFPYNDQNSYNESLGITLGILHGQSSHYAIHEVGHHWGLGENLAELLRTKYQKSGIGIDDDGTILRNLQYSPFYDNLLAEKVGDERIWSFLRPASVQGWSGELDKEYGKLWDDNMTVTVNWQKSPLVAYADFQVARGLCMAYNYGYNDVTQGYEKFTGIQNVLDEFEKMGPVFEKALKTNNATAIKQVRDFIKSIVDYREKCKEEDEYSYIMLAPGRSFVDEWVKAHNDAIKNPKTQNQQTSTVRVNLGQEVGVCR